MKELFLNAPKVSRIVLPDSAQFGQIRLRGSASGYLDLISYVIITDCSVGEAVNAQLSRSLGRDTYLYAFGDNTSKITVSGIAFPESCTGGTNGVKALQDFYENNKVSVSGSAPPTVEVLYDSKTYKGYLMSASFSTTDPSTRVTRFTFNLEAV